MNTTTGICTEAVDISATALNAVARRAHFVASVVANVLLLFEAKESIKKADRRPLPAGFLLQMGAVVQLQLWESAGLTIHVEAGLPTFDAAVRELERRATSRPSEFADIPPFELWRTVLRVWTEHFAWQGEELLGAEITVGQVDEDAFVDAIAEFLWKNRNLLIRQGTDEDTPQ